MEKTIIPLGQKSATGDAKVYRGLLVDNMWILTRQTNLTASDFVFDAAVFPSEAAYNAAFEDPTTVAEWKISSVAGVIGVDFVKALSSFINFEAIY